MSEELVTRLQALEARVTTLEAMVYKRAGIATAVERLVKNWPGPFTAEQIRAALKQTNLDASVATIIQKLYKLEKQAQITRTHQGRGQVGNIWER